MSINTPSPFSNQTVTATDVCGNFTRVEIFKWAFNFDENGKLAPTQNEVQLCDEFYENATNSSIYKAEESMPFKHGFEYLIRGSIQIPQKTLTVTTDLNKKSIDIHLKNYWLKPEKNQKLTLKYENSRLSKQNPVGTKKPILISRNSQPAGFNAIARHWHPRIDLYKKEDKTLWHNVAPLDQRSDKPIQWMHLDGFYEKPVLIHLPKIDMDSVTVDLDSRRVEVLSRGCARD